MSQKWSDQSLVYTMAKHSTRYGIFTWPSKDEHENIILQRERCCGGISEIERTLSKSDDTRWRDWPYISYELVAWTEFAVFFNGFIPQLTDSLICESMIRQTDQIFLIPYDSWTHLTEFTSTCELICLFFPFFPYHSWLRQIRKLWNKNQVNILGFKGFFMKSKIK